MKIVRSINECSFRNKIAGRNIKISNIIIPDQINADGSIVTFTTIEAKINKLHLISAMIRVVEKDILGKIIHDYKCYVRLSE